MNTLEDQVKATQAKLQGFLDIQKGTWMEEAARASLEVVQRNADILLEQQRRLERIAAARQATRSLLNIRQEFALKQILDYITASACSLVEANSAVLIPLTPDGRRFLLNTVSLAGSTPDQFISSDQPRPGGITEFLLTSSHYMVNIEDTNDKKRYPFLDDQPSSFIRRTGVKAFIAVRLGTATETLGLLFVNRTMPHPFDAEELDLIGFFADLATIALQNQHMFERTEHALKRRIGDAQALDQLHSVVARLSNADITTHIDTLLAHVLHTSFERAHAESSGRGMVLLVDEKTHTLVTRASVGLSEEQKKIRLHFAQDDETGRGITSWVAQHGESALVSDVSSDPRYYNLLSDTQSEMAVPLVDARQVIGVINLESPLPHAFSPDDLRLVETLADEAVREIKTVRLWNTLSEINEMVLSIISSPDQDAMLSKFYDSVSKLTNARDIAILALDEAGQELCLNRFPMRVSEGANKVLSVRVGTGVSGRAAQTKDIVYAPDIRLLSGQEYVPWIADTRSNLAVPLLVDNRVIGVLNIESPIPHAFDNVSHELLSILASSTAVAINIALRSQQLIDSQAYVLVASVIGGRFHDLINTISVIRPLLQGIREICTQEESSPPLFQLLDSIAERVETAIQQSREMINQFQRGIQVTSTLEDATKLALQDFPIPPTVELIRAYDEETARIGVRGPLRMILVSLFRNSVKAMDQRGTLTLQAQSPDGWLEVLVIDTGPGIPPELLPDKLFEPGISGPGGGFGYGLWAVRTIVRILGGTVHAENRLGKTILSFRLPRTADGR